MSSVSFFIRNTDLPIFVIRHTNLDVVLEDLKKLLAENKESFIPYQAVVADLSFVIDPDFTYLTSLAKVFTRNNLSLVGICGEGAEKYKETLKVNNLGFVEFKNYPDLMENQEIKPDVAELQPVQEEPKPSENGEVLNRKETMIIRANIRSGQQIYAQNRDLTIVGMVSAGAEVLADGNINVLGALRGRAFAGVQGDAQTYIYASDFKAQLISIAGNYQNLDETYWGENLMVSLNKDASMLFNKL